MTTCGVLVALGLAAVARAEEPAAEEAVAAQAPEVASAVGATAEAAATEAPAPPSSRKRPSTTFSQGFELRYWQLDDRLPGFADRRVLDFIEVVDRWTAHVRQGRWSFFGQLDLVGLGANSYFLDGVRVMERDLLARGTWSLLIPGRFDPTGQGTAGWDLFARNAYVTLEKIRVAHEAPGWSLAVGDGYASFGRGIALDLDRNVDIDVDTSVQGLHGRWRPGDWEVVALIGQLNRQQVFQDNPNLGILGDRRHFVSGLRVERWGLGPVNLGAHGVVWDFTTEEGWKAGFEELATPPDVVVAGATVEALGLGPTDWYLEVDAFAFPTDDTFAGEPRRTGYAAYLSGAVYAGRTTWLLEAKRTFQSQRINTLLATELYQAAVGPTLEYERAITEDSAATTNSEDLWGARLRVDVSAGDGDLVPYASLAVFRDLDLGSLHFNTVPETVVHPVIGLEWTGAPHAVLANVGYRHDDRDGDAFGADGQLHGDVLAKIGLGKGVALELSLAGEWFRWGRNPIQQRDYVEIESAVSVQVAPYVSVTWFTDVSTNPLIDSTGNLTDAVYGAAEVQVKPLPNLTIRAFYGAYKSGIRCSGGQCRVLPGFEGARLSLDAQF